MKTICAKCQAGPSNIDGHEDLYVHSFVGPSVILKCRTCESFWTRRHVDNRSFEWLASSGLQGIMVPSA